MTTRFRAARSAAALCLALALFPGCGDGKIKCYPVTGKVLYNGEPLKGVDVAFHPTDPKNDTGYPPHATTAADGTFTLTTFLKDDGAPAGEFRVALAFAVEAVEEGSDQVKKAPPQLPAQYLKAETSGIVVTIKPESNALDPIKLVGPPRPAGKR